jgi:hypothetical protein
VDGGVSERSVKAMPELVAMRTSTLRRPGLLFLFVVYGLRGG